MVHMVLQASLTLTLMVPNNYDDTKADLYNYYVTLTTLMLKQGWWIIES